MRRQRGMALIQALVIVAAIAAIATALLRQADGARQRLEARGRADQAALYLDGGVDLVRALLAAMPAGPVHRGQPWAQPRAGLEIDRGELAYEIDDLAGRFNVNDLNGETPAHLAAREAFLRLAQAQGLSRRSAARMADALGPDPAARAAAGDPLPLPLADPRQLTPLARDRGDDFAALLPFLAARPPGSAMNANTLRAELWEAWLPQSTRSARDQVMRHLRARPAPSIATLVDWAEEALPPGLSDAIAALPLDTRSALFVARVEARLDTVVLRRSVVLDREAPLGGVAVLSSVPETE